MPESATGGRFVPCHSPRAYRAPKPGRHVFRVLAEASGAGVEYSPSAAFRRRVLGNWPGR